MEFKITPSPLESERFNIKAGKLSIVLEQDVEKILPELNVQGMNFLSVRVDCENIGLVQKLEAKGFFLTDTLVYYKKKISDKAKVPLAEAPYIIREATQSDFDGILKVAEKSFKGYIGHYHTDPRFDNAQADAVYVDWIQRSCKSGFLADCVLVTEENGEISSFASVKKDQSKAEGVLFGVDPAHQGKGIYRELIRASMNWAIDRGCSDIWYSTQINNIAVQKVWVREGCELAKSYYTLHYWKN